MLVGTGRTGAGAVIPTTEVAGMAGAAVPLRVLVLEAVRW
jgi:hypothetical protein